MHMSITARDLYQELGVKSTFTLWWAELKKANNLKEDAKPKNWHITPKVRLMCLLKSKNPEHREKIISEMNNLSVMVESTKSVELSMNRNVQILKGFMTSMELAEVTGKTHGHILRDIDREISRLKEHRPNLDSTSVHSKSIQDMLKCFTETSYLNERGVSQRCYHLQNKAVYQMAARYSEVVRCLIIVEWLDGAKRYQKYLEAVDFLIDQEYTTLITVNTKPYLTHIPCFPEE